MVSDDDNDGQMIFGDLGGLKLPDICLTGEENPKKPLPRKLVPAGDRTRARFVTGAYATPGPQRWSKLFENKVLRKIGQFGARRDEITGKWRKLLHAQLHVFYSLLRTVKSFKSRQL